MRKTKGSIICSQDQAKVQHRSSEGMFVKRPSEDQCFMKRKTKNCIWSSHILPSPLPLPHGSRLLPPHQSCPINVAPTTLIMCIHVFRERGAMSRILFQSEEEIATSDSPPVRVVTVVTPPLPRLYMQTARLNTGSLVHVYYVTGDPVQHVNLPFCSLKEICYPTEQVLGKSQKLCFSSNSSYHAAWFSLEF